MCMCMSVFEFVLLKDLHWHLTAPLFAIVFASSPSILILRLRVDWRTIQTSDSVFKLSGGHQVRFIQG